ncbi:MAG: hypothetical protein ABL973_09820 [Micropepsaceae bacterium]
MSVTLMNADDRAAQIGHFRARQMELHMMSQWISCETSEYRTMLMGRITACDRAVAMLEDD